MSGESISQNDIKQAMIAAMQEFGAAKSTDFANMSGDLEKQARRQEQKQKEAGKSVTGQSAKIETGKGDASAGASSVNTKGLIDDTKSLNKLLELPRKSVELYDGAIKAMGEDIKPMIDQYNALQKTYGGMNVDFSKTTGSARHAIEALTDMKKVYHNVDGAGAQSAANLGQNTNLIFLHWESAGAALTESFKVTDQLIEQYSSNVLDIDATTRQKLAIQAKATGLSHRQIAELTEQEILRTGKASGDMLNNIAMYSEGLSESTGIPLKSIQRNAVNIIKDTQRLGDVTEEEATRMAATLGQLGQTYDSFSGVIGKFDEFGSAAEAASKIQYLTAGRVALDADEAMQVAAESPEKFAEYLRSEFEKSGFTDDDFRSMGLSQQKLLAEAAGFQRDNFISFINDESAYVEGALEEQQKKTKAKGQPAFDSVAKQLGISKKYTDGTKEHMDNLRLKSMIPLQETMLDTAESMNLVNHNMNQNVSISSRLQGEVKGLYEGYGNLTKNMAGVTSVPVEVDTMEGVSTLYNNLEGMIQGGPTSSVQGIVQPSTGNVSTTGMFATGGGDASEGAMNVGADKVEPIKTPTVPTGEPSQEGVQQDINKNFAKIEKLRAKSKPMPISTTIDLSPKTLSGMSKGIGDAINNNNVVITEMYLESNEKLSESITGNIKKLSKEIKEYDKDKKIKEYAELQKEVKTMTKGVGDLVRTVKESKKKIVINLDGYKLGAVLASQEFKNKHGFRFVIDAN